MSSRRARLACRHRLHPADHSLRASQVVRDEAYFKTGGQRIAQVIVYLQAPEAGGCTSSAIQHNLNAGCILASHGSCETGSRLLKVLGEGRYGTSRATALRPGNARVYVS